MKKQVNPAIMTCPVCGFHGNHGFSATVAGIMYYYHTKPGGSWRYGDTCFSYSYKGKGYRTLKAAWLVARKDPRWSADKVWLAAQDAEILENKPRKAKALFKKWRESYSSRNPTALCPRCASRLTIRPNATNGYCPVCNTGLKVANPLWTDLIIGAASGLGFGAGIKAVDHIFKGKAESKLKGKNPWFPWKPKPLTEVNPTHARLPIGKGYKGVEPTGCFNTGVAAVIIHSRSAKKYLDKPYAVGKAMDAEYSLTDNIMQAMRGAPHKVKFYKSAQLAWKEYDRLNGLIQKANREDHEAIAKARQDIKSQDPNKAIAGALTLSDFGLMNPASQKNPTTPREAISLIEQQVEKARLNLKVAKPSKREAAKRQYYDWQSALEVATEIYHSDAPDALERIMGLKLAVKLGNV